MFMVFNILIALIAITIVLYKWKFHYWKWKGLLYVEPSIPFGNLENPFRRTQSLSDLVKSWYDYLREEGVKHGGIFFLTAPVYMPIDLDYVKNIMTKDFSHFTDRGIFYDEKNDPLSAHLFAIGGIKWKYLRAKLTPTFSTGKMRMMFNTMVDCSRIFREQMDEVVDNDEKIDIKDATSRFTTDIIGSCAFGLECHSIADPNNPFKRYSKIMFERSKFRSFLNALGATYPSLARSIGIRVIPEETSKFFMNLVKTTVEYREKNDCRRNDFLQILIDLKSNKLDDEITEKHDGRSLTIEEVAAQCFVFFLAGFETSSTVMSFALFELAQHQEEQEKLREEIKSVLKRYNGKITYEGIAEMKYLQQVLDETLRLYPAVGFVSRVCVKDYKIPDCDLTIEKGTMCMISILGLHHDKEYFPDPQKFDPNRFSEFKKVKIPQHAYIPFGEGPRICIGLRFGTIQAKVGLAVLLSNYRFSLDPSMKLPIKMDPATVVSTVKGGIWLRAKKIQ